MTAVSTSTTPRTRTRVAVIGGGASGVLTAINLLVRSDDLVDDAGLQGRQKPR